eukprot:3544337-Rhodomonas_salina.3
MAETLIAQLALPDSQQEGESLLSARALFGARGHRHGQGHGRGQQQPPPQNTVDILKSWSSSSWASESTARALGPVVAEAETI